MGLSKDTRTAGWFKAEFSYPSTDKHGKAVQVKDSGLIGEHESEDAAFAAAQRLYNSRGLKVHRVNTYTPASK